MKVFILPDSKLMEDYAEIHCVKETETIRKLADYIEVDTRYIIGKNDRQTKHLPIHEIYYFESIDKRTFSIHSLCYWCNIILFEIKARD